MPRKDVGLRRRAFWYYAGDAALSYLDFIDTGTLWNGPLDERIAIFEELARRILREAGLPDRLCYCVQTDGGWREAAPHERSEATCIRNLVRRRPYGRMERAAVRMLGHGDDVRRAVATGDAHTAAYYALMLALEGDGLALEYEFALDLSAGQKVRQGGVKGGRRAREASTVAEQHRQWAEEDERLEAQGRRPTERARLIAKRHSANAETVRSAVRRRRKKLVSEAPSSPGE